MKTVITNRPAGRRALHPPGRERLELLFGEDRLDYLYRLPVVTKDQLRTTQAALLVCHPQSEEGRIPQAPHQSARPEAPIHQSPRLQLDNNGPNRLALLPGCGRVSIRPAMDTEIQIGPTGKKLLPLTATDSKAVSA